MKNKIIKLERVEVPFNTDCDTCVLSDDTFFSCARNFKDYKGLFRCRTQTKRYQWRLVDEQKIRQTV